MKVRAPAAKSPSPHYVETTAATGETGAAKRAIGRGTMVQPRAIAEASDTHHAPFSVIGTVHRSAPTNGERGRALNTSLVAIRDREEQERRMLMKRVKAQADSHIGKSADDSGTRVVRGRRPVFGPDATGEIRYPPFSWGT